MSVKDVLGQLNEESETDRLRATVDRLTRWPFEYAQCHRDQAESAALRYAPSVDELLGRWQHHPPETFDYNEAVAAVVAQLNKEGVTAWNGDATWCVAHMLKAQFDRWAALRAEVNRT